MIEHLLVWREQLRISLWPLPLGMLVLAVLVFAGAGWADARISNEGALRSGWLHSGSGDDARNLVSTLVTALMTMTSVVLSITIVTLTLAASQFGSRLVRVFMTDVRTKLSIGLFLLTIVYCLLVLRTLRQQMPPAEVPHVSVNLALVLAIACVLVMLLFLHHIARSIVADEVVARVARELEDNIESLPLLAAGEGQDLPVHRALPRGGQEEEKRLQVLPQTKGGRILTSSREGYVQAIRYERMVVAAAQDQVVFRLSFRAGDFICRGDWLGEVLPQAQATPALEEAIRSAILIGVTRTPTQDLAFSMRHLVDVALRALSPSINDPNTALVVIDRLRAALSRLMARALPTGLHRDPGGTVRVAAKCHSYGDLLDAAFDQIRQAAQRQPSVIIGMLEAFGRIGEHVQRPDQRDALLRHARLVAEMGLSGCGDDSDCNDIRQALASAQAKIPGRPVQA